MPRSEQYDVALSFAGENRKYVRSVAEDLTAMFIRVDPVVGSRSG
jgi:hypothetical protein